MVLENHTMNNLKAALFDLTLTIENNDEKTIMQKLVNVVQRLFETEQTFIFMHKWFKSPQDNYYSGDGYSSIERLAMERLSDYDRMPVVGTMTDNNIKYHVIKLNGNNHYYGIMFIEDNNFQGINDNLLEKVSESLTQFLNVLYLQHHHQYLHERTKEIFELSKELHAVHETTEIINSVYGTLKKLYPFYDYLLLMSKEYECENVPIKLIEYSSDTAQSTGTMAFIDDSIKVDTLHDKNEMIIYSPLGGEQGVYGVVQMTVPQIVDTTELELDLIEQFSNMAGMAIERTILLQSSYEQINHLQMINHASHELNVNLDRSDIIDIVKRYVLKASEAEEFAVVLYHQTAEKDKTDPYKVLPGSTSYFFSDNGLKLVQHLYETLGVEKHSILSGHFQDTYRNTPYYSLMAVPMWSTDAIFGFVVMVHPTPYYFTLDKFKFIQSFIQHTSLAFKNSLLNEQLRQLATTDHLTKLYSRSFLDKKVTAHMNKADSGTFALFDIDDFKQVNDTYGHYVGDKVLKNTATIIQEKLTTTCGLAARWGGEEFALYFPELNVEESMSKVNEIRRAVYQKTDPQVTLSCGVLEWNKDGIINSIEKLFIYTDEALYEAKSSGKDKTVQKTFN